MTLRDALHLIGNVLGNVDETLSSGLPDGVNSDWGYDEQLILDIGEACRAWKGRQAAKRKKH